MKNRPLIAVSTNRFAADPQRPVFKNMELQYGEAHLLDSVYRAGGLPLLIPDLRTDIALGEYVERCDGLLLAGGADVCPESYGRKDYDAKWPGDKVRDAYEIALIKKAIEAKRPILGVCRGMQVLNVAMGGTLYQDILTEKPGSLIHRDWETYEQNTHDVKLEKGSWLEKLFGKTDLRINTIHHQGVRDLAPSFKAVAFAPDGIIEAVEDKDGRWIRGVQFHPEWQKLSNQGLDGLEIVISDFVSAVNKARHKA